MKSRKHFILNYIFIIGVLLLFLNDHFLKYEFSNWFTGKFSDFIGLLIFPFFLSFIFPNRIKFNIIFTGLFFVFWKSPYSQDFIEFYNSIALIEITRVVDYTDCIALLVLPLSYYLLKNKMNLSRYTLQEFKVHPVVILLPAIVVFMATSPPLRHQFTFSDGNLRFYNQTIKTDMSQKDILEKIKEVNIDLDIYKEFGKYTYHGIGIEKVRYCRVGQLVLDNDTINDLQFSMVTFEKNKDKTKIFINGMTISEDITENEVKNELRKYYKKLLKRYLRKSIKQ